MQTMRAIEYHAPGDISILPLEEILKGFDLMKSGQALRVVLKP